MEKSITNIISFDLVIPCYNPPKDWHQTIVLSYHKLKGLMPNSKIHFILVNDGSSVPIPDNEINYLKEELPSFEYIHYETNKGKGYAIRQGMAKSQQELSIYTDIDFPYQEKDIVDIANRLYRLESDVVIGVKDKAYYENVPLFRQLLSKTLQRMNQYLLGLKVTDTQCGLKGFNSKGKEIFLTTTINRYLFDLEFIYLSSKQDAIRIMKNPLSLKPGVVFTSIQIKHIMQELLNFAKVFFK